MAASLLLRGLPVTELFMPTLAGKGIEATKSDAAAGYYTMQG